MALRYAPVYDENGDVIDPAFFLENDAEFVSEWNGLLDRDNFAQADIVADDVDTSPSEVFIFMTSEKSDTAWSPTQTVTEWQGGEGNDADGIVLLDWTATQDAHYEVHFSASWAWTGAYSWVWNNLARPDRLDTFDTIMFRITMDGIPIAFAGPFEDGDIIWSTYMCGAIQCAAGVHTLKVECEIVRRISQNGQLDGPCTNPVEIQSRACVVLGRLR